MTAGLMLGLAVAALVLVAGVVVLRAWPDPIDRGLTIEAEKFGTKPRAPQPYDSAKAVAGMARMRQREADAWRRRRRLAQQLQPTPARRAVARIEDRRKVAGA